MNQENYVIFKGTKDGVTVLFQPDVPFEELCTMRITFVKTENNELKQISELLEKDIRAFNLTKFHRGSLRNGQKIEFDGSVVVVGDVNPGAEIKATGNIIVLGQLKGMAHAGCKGMTDAFVTAGPKPPEYAFVKDGQIFVMALS